MRSFRSCVAVFAFLLGGFACLGAAAEKRMNLLLITADDMNGDSWFNSKVPTTPQLDAFAKTGYRFERMHVSAPICQPSRSALMTGRVPHRNGALGFNPINLDVPTLVEVMSGAGYLTAALNKTPHMAPASKFKWDLPMEGSGKNPKLLREQFEQCLKAAADQKKPFFINVNITDPHRPFAGAGAGGGGDEDAPAAKKKKKAGKKQSEAAATAVAVSVPPFDPKDIWVPTFLEDLPDVRKEVAQYWTSVRRLDLSFGGIIAALKASGQEDNTIIVFMSDHGMSFPYSKATLYRNGTWSPLVIKIPGAKPFINQTDFISSVDIMPSVLALLQVPPPPGMDGRSFVPIMLGGKQPDRDHVFTHVNTVSSGKSFPGRCVRTANHAYIWNEWPDGKTVYRVEAMSGLTWNAIARAGETDARIKRRADFFLFRAAEEFYDDQKDPDERVNLINDAASKAEIARMKKLLLAHMEQTNDPLLEKFRQVAAK